MDEAEERVIEDVARFLLAQGGSWSEGTATDFHRQLDSPYKPERPDELGKILTDRMESRGDISYQTKRINIRKEDGSPTTRQIVQVEILS